MVGAEGGQSFQAAQQERVADEDVIERPAQEPVARVKGVVHAPGAWIEHPAEPAEQTAGVRPGHVVEVAGDDRRPVGLRDLTAGDDQLGVARQRAVLRSARRLRVQAVQHDHVAGAQAHAGADGRHVRLEQKAHLRVDQLEPGQQHHAVGVGQRVRDPERMIRQGALEVFAPPRVGLDREDEVGIVRKDDVA